MNSAFMEIMRAKTIVEPIVISRPHTRSMISTCLLLAGVAACLYIILALYTGYSFAGPPTSAYDVMELVLALSFWIPVAASWRYPRIGFGLFVLLLCAELAKCVFAHYPHVECFSGLITLELVGIPLLLNIVYLVYELGKDEPTSLRP